MDCINDTGCVFGCKTTDYRDNDEGLFTGVQVIG